MNIGYKKVIAVIKVIKKLLQFEFLSIIVSGTLITFGKFGPTVTKKTHLPQPSFYLWSSYCQQSTVGNFPFLIITNNAVKLS